MHVSRISEMDVVDTVSGRVLGPVVDLELSLKDGRVTAVVLSDGGGGLFRRGSEMVIPISRILRFGEDVILVELPGPGAPAAEETAPL